MILDCERWGSKGETVVLVHGSLNIGPMAFQEQKVLGARWKLVVPNRRGYGNNPPIERVDPDIDAMDIAELLGSGGHLVGTSMGGVVAARAAALVLDKVSSLTLIEVPAYPNAMDISIVAKSAEALKVHWEKGDKNDLPMFLKGFIDAMEMNMVLPTPLPLSIQAAAKNLLTESPWLTGIPLEKLRAANFPKLVVSGTSSPVFEAICDRLTEALDASRYIFPNAGHGAQRIGEPFNKLLETFMRDHKI